MLGPGRASGVEGGCRAGPISPDPLGLGESGLGSTRHADAVVTVTGHRVEPAQLIGPLRQGGRHCFQSLDDDVGKLLGGLRPRGRDRDVLSLLGQRCGVEVDLTNRATTVSRGVAGRQPQRFNDLVEPHQSQRNTCHVEAGDELPHLRVDDRQPRLLETTTDVVPQHEEFLVLGGAKSVDDRDDPGPRIVRAVGQQPVDEHGGDLVGRTESLVMDTWLPVDTHADTHLTRRDTEQRLVSSRQGAPGEGHPEGPGAIVDTIEDLDDLVDVTTFLTGSRCHLEDREVAGDATTLEVILGACRGDVVGDEQATGVDAFAAQPFRRLPEVQDVTGVVAKTDEDSRSPIRRLADRVGLGG